MNHHDTDQKFAKLVEGQRLVMFATTQPSGAIVSRPMTVQEHEGNVFRFIAQADNAVTQEADGQQVNLSVMDGGTYLSISGRCHSLPNLYNAFSGFMYEIGTRELTIPDFGPTQGQ